jgi:hypothetical protein
MNEGLQIPLFDWRRDVRTGDPQTSAEAAQRLDLAERISKMEAVWGWHASHPLGLTDDEMRPFYANDATLDDSYRKRRKDLARLGLLENSGTYRLTGKGRRAIVWRITPEALALYWSLKPLVRGLFLKRKKKENSSAGVQIDTSGW